jgi:hypothetical protein
MARTYKYALRKDRIDRYSYNWGQHLFNLVVSESSDIKCLVMEAGLDPENGDLSDIDFRNIDLSHQDLSGWDLSNASFDNAIVTGTKFHGSRISALSIIKAKDWDNAEIDQDIRKDIETLSFFVTCALPISVLRLSGRLSYAMMSARIERLSELIKLSEADILGMPNIGRKSANEVQRALTRFGLKLNYDASQYSDHRIMDEFLMEVENSPVAPEILLQNLINRRTRQNLS